MIREPMDFVHENPRDYDHHQIEESLKLFEAKLWLLQYEGKPVLGRNLRDLDTTLSLLERQLSQHFRVEEKTLFPFLSKHIPKLAPALRMLETDHCDLAKTILSLRAQLQHFNAKQSLKARRQTRELKDSGVYFACALKTHLEAEDRIVLHALQCDLKSEEEKMLKAHFHHCSPPSDKKGPALKKKDRS